VANFGVIGPYFFEDEDERAVTVTSARYVEMLRNSFTPEMSRCGIEPSTISFQQMPIKLKHPRKSFGKCFRSTLLQCAASCHGLHVRLTSLPVIISFGGTSKRKCTPLNTDHRRPLKFQRYQETWSGERVLKSVNPVMGNISHVLFRTR
jgi:hypothetical protein